jgi:hypothetical protein
MVAPALGPGGGRLRLAAEPLPARRWSDLRDDLIGQRDTARAYTASAMTPAPGAVPGPSPDNGHQPGQDQGRPSKPRLFSRRPAAAPQAVSADPEPLTAQAAPDVPADAPAPDVPAGAPASAQ